MSGNNDVSLSTRLLCETGCLARPRTMVDAATAPQRHSQCSRCRSHCYKSCTASTADQKLVDKHRTRNHFLCPSRISGARYQSDWTSHLQQMGRMLWPQTCWVCMLWTEKWMMATCQLVMTIAQQKPSAPSDCSQFARYLLKACPSKKPCVTLGVGAQRPEKYCGVFIAPACMTIRVSADLTLGCGLAKMTCQAEVTNLEDPVPQLDTAGKAKSTVSPRFKKATP